MDFNLLPDGSIPVWLVTGPFEQPISGFGTLGDDTLIVVEKIQPWVGKQEKTSLLASGKTSWEPLVCDAQGYTDINSVIGFQLPSRTPNSPWYGRAAYFSAYLECQEEQSVDLMTGSFGELTIYLNGIEIGRQTAIRQAQPDQDSFPLTLKAGRNILLVKAFHSHRNYSPDFFVDRGYGWGLFARLVDRKEKPVDDIKVTLTGTREKTEISVVSTFFFKDSTDNNLYQRFDLIINSRQPVKQQAHFKADLGGEIFETEIPDIVFGINRRSLWIPAVEGNIETTGYLTLGTEKVESLLEFREQPRYKLHFAMLSHLDIGYTNTQPVVQERQVRTLDEVVEACQNDANFHWTIETIWQLDQFRTGASPGRFEQLIELIREGRVAIGPWYSNSFTGMISEEEMFRSLDRAGDYHDEYGIEFPVAIFNDTPGLNWQVPQALTSIGTDFLVCGLNEVYTDLPLQRNLPKYFNWQGGDGSVIKTYLTDTYTEGVILGLEKNSAATAARLWQYLNQLQYRSYPYDIVLVPSAWGDNTGIPVTQYKKISEWNEQYAYPRFIVSNVNRFRSEFLQAYPQEPEVLHGDWTSTWESRFQGEPDLIANQRWVQYNLPGAEKLNSINWFLDSNLFPLTSDIETGWRNMLDFSGHGSGLEYGYGSRSDNQLTKRYREQYVDQAYYTTKAIQSRAIFRNSISEESFDNEAILVFNPLSWERDAVMSMDFPAVFNKSVRLIDLSTSKDIPCHTAGDRLIFIVPDLPSVGYKKIRMERNSDLVASKRQFSVDDKSISNRYYKLTIDPVSGNIFSVIDRKNQRELISPVEKGRFAAPVKNSPQEDNKPYPIRFDNSSITINELYPAGVSLTVRHPGELFEKVEYSLYANQPWIDLEYTVNLNLLEAPEKVEEYGINLPVDRDLSGYSIDLAGGPLKSSDQILPGAETGYYSIRESYSVYNDECVASETIGQI